MSGLPERILRGEKTSTWRIDDDKDLSINDPISLCDKESKEFATAKIISVKETTFEKLTAEDWEGNKKHISDEAMYSHFSTLYNKNITPKTKLKIIKFKLTSKEK